MEAVIDKFIEEIKKFKDLPYDEGGCQDVLDVEAIFFGDPGVISADLYPCFTVEATRDTPVSETTGYEVRDLTVTIAAVIDARSYFNASVEEASGDRELVRTMGNLRRWLRGTANRQLDGLAGVREVTIQGTDYRGEIRDSVIAKAASITVVVNKSYPRTA